VVKLVARCWDCPKFNGCPLSKSRAIRVRGKSGAIYLDIAATTWADIDRQGIIGDRDEDSLSSHIPIHYYGGGVGAANQITIPIIPVVKLITGCWNCLKVNGYCSTATGIRV